MFLNWEFVWFLDNVLFFNYIYNELVYYLYIYMLVFKGKEDFFIKYNFMYLVDILKINLFWYFFGEIKLGGGGFLYWVNVDYLWGILFLIKLLL